MIKHMELSTSHSCLNKARVDEPVFVLRAKDPFAPQAIRLWATMSVQYHEPEKIDEALALADAMEAYRTSWLDTPVVARAKSK